jgi:hypothetical protein
MDNGLRRYLGCSTAGIWRSRHVLVGQITLAILIMLITALPGSIHGSIAFAAGNTTAWQNGQLVMDTSGVVQRSNVILGQPNLLSTQSMPLGNGTLGAAVWSASGLTAQLNRTDTFPDRKAVGQLVVPGLTSLTGASN